MVLVINLMFVIFYEVKSEEDHITFKYVESKDAILILSIIQALVSFIVLYSYFQVYHGVINQLYQEGIQEEKQDKFTNIKGSIGYAFGSESTNISRQRARIDNMHLFNLVYFMISFAGIFYQPLFSILLLDIVIKIPLLSNVVQAIVKNRWSIFYTMMLLFVIIYIYSFIAFQAFRDNYLNSDNNPDDNPSVNVYCDSLIMCFTSTLNNGLRSGGGIGDVLKQLGQNDDKYWLRYVFDLSFFVVIIILMLNLIFGIIIDAFAEKRDQRKSIEEDVQQKCFICGIDKFTFETKKKSYNEHILKEHNVFAYLYFILSIQQKPDDECTRVEKYVKSLVLLEDPSFFPVDKCISFQQNDQEPETQI